MKVPAVEPTYKAKPRRYRAQMSVRHDKHTVTDSETGQRFELDPVQAWEKFEEINELV